MLLAPETVSLVIIDDDAPSLRFLKIALSQHGVEIYTASCPLEGLELIRRHRPSMVLTDLRMAGLSGLEVLRRVKSMAPATQVLIMTAAPSAATRRDALRDGATRYLEKPIDVSILRRGLGELVDIVRRRAAAVGEAREESGFILQGGETPRSCEE